jgi:UPF0716 protein FxsA
MCLVVFLLFTVVPVLEVALLISVASSLGVWPTVGIVIAPGMLGTLLARRQGFRALRDFQQALAESGVPSREVLDGFLILAAGLLLTVPGLITDTFGLFLLTPFGRSAARAYLLRWIKRGVERGHVQVYFRTPSHRATAHSLKPRDITATDGDLPGVMLLPPPQTDEPA